MKLGASLFLLGLATAIASPSFADEVLVSFTGFDYDVPAPSSATYLQVGDGYRQVGFATSFHPVYLDPFVDQGAKEYTYYLSNLTVNFYDFTGTTLTVTFTDGGRDEYYEDANRDARNDPNPPNCPRYGINPPNADAPSRFINGTFVLGGTLTGAYLYYDYSQQSGGFSAGMTVDSGSWWTANYIPIGAAPGWLLASLVKPPVVATCPAPAGYDHQVTGECRQDVTAATHGTWGALKKLYR
jgi:hypothetical protein